jgi:3-isopropylmalate dehydrogenase
MRGRRYTIACLAGNGAGPELMAEASRALAAAASPHGLALEQVHAPFGSEAFVQFGHPLPLSTRRVYRGAHAVLVAGSDPTFEGVEADLDLRAVLARVVAPGLADLCVVGALDGEAEEWAVGRAVELASSRRGRITAVGSERSRGEHLARAAELFPGLQVERLARAGALARVAAEPHRHDVVVADRAFAEALSHVTAFGAPRRVVAFGRLSPGGPGLFFPDHGTDDEAAGHGALDPASMLLAAALALGEGLGERPAARTLEAALFAARHRRASTGSLAATTRELGDVVLAALPSAVATAEFAREATQEGRAA